MRDGLENFPLRLWYAADVILSDINENHEENIFRKRKKGAGGACRDE